KKIRKIDTLVLTHPDPDHLKGLNFIASNFAIGQFWDNGFFTDSETFLKLETTLLAKKTSWLFINEQSPPQTIDGVQISFFNPPLRMLSQSGSRSSSILNNHSLVMKLQFRNVSFLLPGDVEKEAEERMVKGEHSLKADLLKVPHHGSHSSSTVSFLERVKPAYAIVSVGDRNIGRLPHPEVLKRYQEIGARIFRTDQNGAITVMTDGEKIEVRTFR
ncbi:MAG: MBL fold metallo-hydrolase, partial [Deltaproteobacteria bacterium]